MNRIFISYRSSDGKKDADRLCADLSRLYGADQVFFGATVRYEDEEGREQTVQIVGVDEANASEGRKALVGTGKPASCLSGGNRIDRVREDANNAKNCPQQQHLDDWIT